MRSLIWILLLGAALFGCAGYAQQVSRQAAEGVVQGATTGQAAIDVAALSRSVVASARDEALGPATEALLAKLVRDLGEEVRRQVATIITRELVRALVDEALGQQTRAEVAAIRETMFGAPLQQDVDALVADAVPKIVQAASVQLQSTIGPIEAKADQEAAKWRPVAIGFAAGSMLLLAGLAILLHHHRRLLTSLRLTAG